MSQTEQPPASARLSRRDALRLGSAGAALATVGAPSVLLGTLAAAPGTANAALGDDPSTPLGRLKIAVRSGVAPTRTYDPLVITQGAQNTADPVAATVIYPSPRGFGVNPNPATLADIPQVWGWRRDTWKKWTANYINSAAPNAANASWYQPISKVHTGETVSNSISCGLHFVFTGQAFEALFAGTEPYITLIADGRYMSLETIRKTSAGVALNRFNCFTRFDFGYRATRHISLYGNSTQGVAALAIGPQDSIQPWVRDTEASFCAMSDSYGSGWGVNWGIGGPLWEAASLLGIPHLDVNTIGGTGYSRNNATPDTRAPGNIFGARLPDSVSAKPDLFFTAGGINDNNWLASPPLYNTPAEAEAAFNDAVAQYYRDLRAALPTSVLVAMGPWQPKESKPQPAPVLTRSQQIKTSLAAVGGPWVFLDNLNGGWINSAGASAPPTGAWQTGTGRVGAPMGDGNGDIYIADGVHPTLAGNVYLGQVIADDLRAALLAL